MSRCRFARILECFGLFRSPDNGRLSAVLIEYRKEHRTAAESTHARTVADKDCHLRFRVVIEVRNDFFDAVNIHTVQTRMIGHRQALYSRLKIQFLIREKHLCNERIGYVLPSASGIFSFLMGNRQQ
jgi:hypothetical protein